MVPAKIVSFAKTDKQMPACTVFPLMLIRAAGLPLVALEHLAAPWQVADTYIQLGQTRLKYSGLLLQTQFDKALEILPESPERTAVYNARKVFFQRQKLPAGDLAARLSAIHQTPEIDALLSSVQDYREAEQSLEEVREGYRFHYELALLRGYQALQQIAQNEMFQRALLFASHTLLEQLPRFCATPAENFSKKERHTALAVLQYATRMATKTSPLSRLTTLAVQDMDAKLQTDADEHPQTGKSVVTPNVAILEAIYDLLLREPAFYRSLSLRLNPCIVSLPEKTYQWLFFNGEQESFQKMESSEPLNFIAGYLLENERQVSFESLLKHLQTGVDAEPRALENFILELTDLGFLEWVLPENGLSPGWCGSLYQYLGFLPAEPLIVQTAALLQWLRTAARTLPFQPVEAALATLKETGGQLRQYFEQFGVAMPPIPVEQIFYEDAQQPVKAPVPRKALHNLMEQLAKAWQKRPVKPLPENRAALAAFLDEHFPKRRPVGFFDFARQILVARGMGLNNADTAQTHSTTKRKTRQTTPLRLGAMLQFYRENGRWHAVVNALYPGGGKMFARWLHLFPSDIIETLETWVSAPNVIRSRHSRPDELHPETAESNAETQNAETQNSKLIHEASGQNSKLLTPFSWQGWFNANFQPPLTAHALAVPGGRLQMKPTGKVFLLGHLAIKNSKSGPVLFDRVSGNILELNDLGLEAPETRPPAMRLLWQCGVPFVSLDNLIPDDLWQPFYDENVRHRARHTYGDLVLARATWAVAPALWQIWRAADPMDFFVQIREALSDLIIPRWFFARFAQEKPQYFDRDSPVLMMLFQKMLRQGAGTLYMTEMLPTPEQAFVEEEGMRAAEFVVEICI